jgi:hypothetical protein
MGQKCKREELKTHVSIQTDAQFTGGLVRVTFWDILTILESLLYVKGQVSFVLGDSTALSICGSTIDKRMGKETKYDHVDDQTRSFLGRT